jgi:nucleotide-binding universal stress UspA family protein
MFRTIMVPLDRTRFAEAALPTAIYLARQHAADLLLVTVWQHVPIRNDNSTADSELWKWEESCREDDRRYMNDVARRVEEASGRTVFVRYLLGDPGAELAKLAASGEVDAAVVSAHARGAVSRTLLRSVTDRLARKGGIPVFLIHPEGSSPEVEIAPRGAFQHVLMPLDGSPLGEAALSRHFLAGLDFRASTITLLHVLPPAGLNIVRGALPAGEPGLPRRGELAVAEAYLAGVAERLTPWGFRVQTRVLTSSSVAAAILGLARAESVDLIAMATHGRGGLARALPGSVADAVVKDALVPTLLFPPARKDESAKRREAAVPW